MCVRDCCQVVEEKAETTKPTPKDPKPKKKKDSTFKNVLPQPAAKVAPKGYVAPKKPGLTRSRTLSLKQSSAEHKRITGAIQDAMGNDATFKGKKKCPADRLQYVIKKALIPPCKPEAESITEQV